MRLLGLSISDAWFYLIAGAFLAGVPAFFLGKLVAFGEFVRALEEGKAEDIVDLIHELEK